MAETLDLKMVLNLKDKATKKLQKFNKELLKTQKLMKQTGQLKVSTSGGSGGSGGGNIGGLATGVGALGAGSAIASGLGSGSKAARILVTALANVQKQVQSVDQHILAMSTNLTGFAEHMIDGKSATEAMTAVLEEDHFGNAAEAVDQYGDRVDKSSRALKNNIKRQAKSQKETKKQTKNVNELSKAYGKLKGLIATYIGASTIRKIIEVGAQYQDLKTTLKIVTGSLEEQGKAFNFIKNLALELPVSVAQLTEAFIRMESLGIAPTEHRLISFTNTASAMNKTLRQMTEAVADAATFQFERLKEFGIKAEKIKDKVKFTFRGNVTEVKAEALAIVGYLEKIGATSKKAGDEIQGVFGGAATEKMKNFNGVLSNTQDKLSNLASEVFEGGLGDGLITILSLVGELADWFSSLSRDVRLMGVATIQAIDFFVTGFTNRIKILTLGVEIMFSNMWQTLINTSVKGANMVSSAINTLASGLFDLNLNIPKMDTTQLRSYNDEIQALVDTQKEEADLHDKAIRMWVDDINKTEDAKKVTSDYAQTLRDRAKAMEAARLEQERANAKLTSYAKFLKEVRATMNESINTQDYAKQALNDLTKEYNAGTLSLRQYTMALSQLVDETGEALAETDEYAEFLANIRESAADSVQTNKFAKKALAQLTDEYNKGKISLAEYSVAMNDLVDTIGGEKFEESLSETTMFLQQAAQNMQDAMGDTFFDWMQGKTTDMVGDFKRMLDKMVAQALAAKLMNALLGDFGTTGSFGGIAGQIGDLFRAEGGPVSASSSYIVGEKGPELFTPKSDGNIIPNDQLGSIGGDKSVVVNITAFDSKDVQQSLEANRRYIAELVNGTNQTYNLA